MTPARQARVLDETAHRPWPVPEGTWVQAQTWERLAFLHWPVPEDALRGLVPTARLACPGGRTSASTT